MKIKYLFTIILILFSKKILGKPILKYNENNLFKIVLFTDLHYGDDLDDMDTLNSQINVLEYEKPDLVVFNGDMVTGYWDTFKKVDNYKLYWDMFTTPCTERKIPWVITFGNHDGEGTLDATDMMELDQTYDYSLSEFGSSEIHGVANYYLKVYSSGSSGTLDSDISSLVYIFDSATSGCSKQDWGCIHEDQIDWFKNISNQYNKTESVAFVHIPPIEVNELWNSYPVNGLHNETSCCFDNEYGEFVPNLIASGDVKGLFFGHDHLNDYHGNMLGLELGYGRKSGAGSYSSGKPLGARVIQLTDPSLGFKLSTWIRETDGSIDTQSIIHQPNELDNIPLQCKKKDKYSKVEILVMKIVCSVIGSIIILTAGFLIFKKVRRNNQINELKQQKYSNCIL